MGNHHGDQPASRRPLLVIAALIAVAAITAMQGLGNKLKTTFNNVSSNMKAS